MQTPKNRFAAADRLKLGRPESKDIDRVREAIRNQAFESAFAWDAAGKLVAARDGGKERVSLLGEEFAALSGGVVLHSHPNETPFSILDLRIARNFKLARSEVVSKRFHYLFERPAGGWQKVSQPVWDDSLFDLKETHGKIVNGLADGSLREVEALEEFDKAMLQFSQQTKCPYARIL